MTTATISIEVDSDAARAFAAASDQERRKLELLLGLRLKELTSSPTRPVREIMEQLGEPSVTPITSLAPRPFQVVQPILAVVREDDGAFVASFADANINASGDARTEALEMLKDSLASRFRFYSENEAHLGVEPQRQLAVLREFLRER